MNARDFSVDACVAAYDEGIDHADFVAKRAEYYVKQNVDNCLEAVYATDENKVMATLIMLMNDGRKAYQGDSDEKFAYVDMVNALARRLIFDYASEKAELDWEHRND